MAAQFTEVTLDEMDRFIKRGWRAYRPKQGVDRGEVYYDLFLSDHVLIRVWTTIHPRREVGADVGADAMRIQLLAKHNGRPLTKGKAPIVKRTQGWKNNLQDRIEDFIETYEDQEGYFEERAGGHPGQEKLPMQEPALHTPPPIEYKKPNYENEGDPNDLHLNDGDPEPPPPPPRRTDLRATFQRLRNGDWGLRVQGHANPGDRVLAETKGGKKQYLVVGEVVWRGDGVTVATIAQSPRTAGQELNLNGEEENSYGSYEREA